MNNENKLEDVWFIGGGTEIFIFNVLDRNGEPLELAGSQIKWTLSYIGEKDTPIIVKHNGGSGGVTFGVNKGSCKIEVNPSDTSILDGGKYEQELIVIQPNGKVLRPCYGYVDVRRGSQY